MILTDKEILSEMEKGNIIIDPYDRDCLGSNSYDVHLSKNMAVYKDDVLDCKAKNEIKMIEIPEEGLILVPNRLYLG
ncbi:MAG: dCTP deaminase, partial [Spirochaetota bacterium]|nr:dCTP deaminase [Spirochaetota bacterium]